MGRRREVPPHSIAAPPDRGRRWDRTAARTLNRVGLAIVFVSLAAGFAPAHAKPGSAEASAAPAGYVPRTILERPLPLRKGIGNSHETVTTSSTKAQSYYDQGLNYLESYVWIEAARSFHEALRLDPNLALAYVGLSRAETGLDNSAAAKYYLDKAKTLTVDTTSARVKPSDRERSIVEIREKQLAALQDLGNLTKLEAYRIAIDEALADHLDDPELWLRRGIASESNAAGEGQRGTAASIPYYELILRLAPDHASAHHYLIHSYESVRKSEEALEHGKAYARLAPSIPHAAHMWAHALRRAGRLDDAIAQLLKADALERAYYKAERIDPSLDWHHEHNLEVLRSCYEQKGDMKAAEKVVRELATLGTGAAEQAFNRKELPDFLIHRGRYEEALREARAMSKSKHPQARAAGHALAGKALVGLERLQDARRELEAARRELERVPRSSQWHVPRRSAAESLVKDLEEALALKGGSSGSTLPSSQR